jgi:hypothetical protein
MEGIKGAVREEVIGKGSVRVRVRVIVTPMEGITGAVGEEVIGKG